MSQAGEGHSGSRVDEADVDTIEMELRPEDLARLAQISAGESVASTSTATAHPANAPGEAASVRQSNDIQDELAALLGPRPAEGATALPDVAPPPDAPAAPAKNALPSVTDKAQISKPTASEAGTRVSPLREARVEPPTPSVAPAAREAPTQVASGDVPRGARWLGIALIGLFAIGAASVWLSSLASRQADDPPPLAPMEAIEPEPAPTPVAPFASDPPALPAGEVVKFRNPFDAAEVFEFPAGTNRTDARQAVSQFLLQRACERQSRTAATSACGQATTPADLLRTTADP